MLNQYETVFICTPVLSEPQVKETVKKLRLGNEKTGLPHSEKIYRLL